MKVVKTIDRREREEEEEPARRNNSTPRNNQITAFEGRMIVAAAARLSARARFPPSSSAEEGEGWPLFASSSFPSAGEAELGGGGDDEEEGKGQYTSAQHVRAVSVELLKVRERVKKWKKERREARSCAIVLHVRYLRLFEGKEKEAKV